MIVLGVESSCDETAIALVRDGRQVLSSLVSSQISVHAPYGGVVPEIAAREHLRSCRGLLREALRQAGVRAEEVDLIAVTQGPGLIGALLVGASFARGLATSLCKPLLPVDHVHGHVHGALLGLPDDIQAEDVFPSLSLVVSGGHTNLYYMKNPVHFELIASTVDDACGECLDKVAKLMGLPYPGGPHIEKLASGGNPQAFKMPKMVPEKKKMIFSYSGLKTHMAYLWEREGPFRGQELKNLAAAFQDEAFGQIQRKIHISLQRLKKPVRSVVIAGGVAANQRFRSLLTSTLGVDVHFPGLTYCADNAAMIAGLGWHLYHRMSPEEKKSATTTPWDNYSRYRFEQVTTDPQL